MKKMKLAALALITLLIAAGILCYPGDCAAGAKQGLSYCGNLLIPSIFPFLVLSVFVVKSGVSKAMSRILNPVTRLLFRLPGSAGATVLIGLIGGYPAGARGVKALLEQGEITPGQARRMLCFCVGAGPAFVITVAGTGLLGSARAGIVLFASQIAAALLLGMVTGLFSKRESVSRPAVKQNEDEPAVSAALVESAADGAMSMLNMCAFVILFSALLGILDQSGLSEKAASLFAAAGLPESASSSLLPVLMEVTTGCSKAAANGASPLVLSFALGWAGLCVHFQIFSMLRSVSFSKLRFLLFRFLHGVLAAFFTAAGLHFFPISKTVFFSTGQAVSGAFALHADGGILLLFMCVVFLLSLFVRNARIKATGSRRCRK